MPQGVGTREGTEARNANPGFGLGQCHPRAPRTNFLEGETEAQKGKGTAS